MPFVSKLERAKKNACPFGVSDMCLVDKCQAWVAGVEWEETVTGVPYEFPKKTFFEKIFGAGIRVAPMVRGVEHGHCSRIGE